MMLIMSNNNDDDDDDDTMMVLYSECFSSIKQSGLSPEYAESIEHSLQYRLSTRTLESKIIITIIDFTLITIIVFIYSRVITNFILILLIIIIFEWWVFDKQGIHEELHEDPQVTR